MTTESQPLTGRDLDAAIAEKLFGYFASVEAEKMHDALGPLVPLPHYSSSWDAMRLVVEEMQRRGDGISRLRIVRSWACQPGAPHSDDLTARRYIKEKATLRRNASAMPH